MRFICKKQEICVLYALWVIQVRAGRNVTKGLTRRDIEAATASPNGLEPSVTSDRVGDSGPMNRQAPRRSAK